MNKTLAILLVIGIISGCSTTSQTYTYRPKGSNSSMWLINGDFNFATGDIRISINGEPAVIDKYPIMTLEGISHGTYNGIPVIADCKYHIKLLSSSYEECTVRIDDEVSAVVRMEQPGT